jgi:nitrous oxidase accessory protein
VIAAAAGLARGQGDEAEHAPPQPFEAHTPAAAAPVAQSRGEIGRLIAAAAEGATIEIPAGVYREHIRIDRPLTLVGRKGAIIDGGGKGDIVEITAPDVTLRGFTIRNTGIDLDQENAAIRALAPRAVIEDNVLENILFGIDLKAAPDSVVRGNRIGGKELDIARRGDGLRLWRSDNTLVEGNVIHDGRDAILWYSTGVVIRGNESYDCRYGLHLMFSDEVTIEDNVLRGNSVGIYLMYSAGVELRRNRLLRNRGPSGYGIGLKETDRFTVSENIIAANRVGVYIDGSPFTTAQPGVFSGNTIAWNDIGFTFLPSARGNEIAGNNFIDNIEQVSVAGRGDLSGNQFWASDRGNFWSDYTGYDEDGDGVGDFVHESMTLFENMMDREPSLRLFLFSPAQQAIEFVGRVLPAVRPEPKFIDEVPLMRPVAVASARPEAMSALPLAATGAGLLALGAGVLWAASPRGGGIRRRRGTTHDGRRS